MKVSTDNLSLAGEYAVASELCRRGLYAQLTLGHRKRTDLLVETESGRSRVEVKAKQGKSWPGCKGIFGENTLLVFVDFENKKENERPDFYILTAEDWKNLVNRICEKWISKGEMTINDQNVPVWRSKTGKSYEGTEIEPKEIKDYKERWDKFGKPK